MVRRTVRADQACPVQAERHRNALHAHVMDDLIVGPLQEGRVDRRHRPHPRDGQSRREGHAVGLGDAHVEKLRRMPFLEIHQACPVRHRRRDGDDPVVFRRQTRKSLGKDLAVVGRRRFSRGRHRAGRRVERGDAVVHAGVGLRVRQTLALLGDHVQEPRPLDGFQVRQDPDHLRQVVPVDRAVILKAERLEQTARHDHFLERAFHPLGQLSRGLPERHLLEDLPHLLLEAVVVLAAGDARQVLGDRSHVRGNRHLVVVQDDQNVPSGMASVVQALVGEPAGHGAVPGHGDDVIVLPRRIPSDRDPHGGGDRSARVSHSEGVVGRFGRADEAGEPVVLPDRGQPIPASGQHLVPVRLVPHVPHDLVLGRVEAVVERDGQLHRTETGREMSARLGHHLDDVLTQLGRELLEVARRQTLHVRRRVDERQNLFGGRPGFACGSDALQRSAANGRNTHLAAQRLRHRSLRLRNQLPSIAEVTERAATWPVIIDPGARAVKKTAVP